MSTAPLTGVRAAILRSLLVGIAACALAALVAGFLPGRIWVTEVVDPSGVHAVVDREAAIDQVTTNSPPAADRAEPGRASPA